MLLLSRSMTVLAVSEADVEAVGKETASGNLLIWFLCAIAFLKVSQKIDSFMGSLGINVGHTGGSMLAEMMVAARGITTVKNISGGGSFHGGSFHGGGNTSSISNASFLSGGLAGVVGRQFAQSAMQTMTGRQAAQALTSYMGQTGIPDAPSYSGVEIGGGRILGTETSVEHPNGTAFGMYHADQYMAPEGSYETVTMADNSTWYRQYATDTVERTPYMTGEGKIAYHENLVQKLPNMPKRKDRV